MSIAKKLQQICLSEKEALIYSSLLDAGEAPAVELAERSGINRATTYIALESLVKLGLVRRLKKNKKTFFRLESPEHILDLLENKKEEVEIKIKLAKEMLPELEMLEKVTIEKTKVRFFEGKEGIKLIQKDIIRTNPKYTCEIFNINSAVENFPPSKNDHRSKVIQKKIIDRAIIVYDPKVPIPYLPPLYKQQRRFLPQNKKMPFNMEVVLYKNKVALVSTKKKLLGVVIENDSIVDGLRFLFELAWQGAEKYKIIKSDK